MEKIRNILMGFLLIGYFAMGLVQMVAIYTFFSDHWGWWFIFAGPAAFIVAEIPILGGILGVIAANQVWGWNIWASILLFFWPLALYIPLLLIGGSAAAIESIQRKKAS